MKKKVPTRVGNVYCVEIDDKFKRYFHFLIKDETSLNGNVIRVFKTRYKLDENPDIETIVADETDFYAETFILWGLYANAWYYVGKSKNLRLEEIKNIWFATRENENKFIQPERRKLFDYEEWNKKMWKINGPLLDVPEIPSTGELQIYPGGVFSSNTLLTRLKTGYYVLWSDLFDIIKRVPYADTESYTTLENEFGKFYFHFTGEYIVEMVEIRKDGKKIVMTREELPPAFYKLKFGDINWEYPQFITADEFNQALKP